MRAIILRPALFCLSPTPIPRIIQRVPRHARYQSTAPTTAALSPRWLSDVKQRIGKCIMFGISSAQTQEAGSILQEIAKDWRELVAGSEGFLTGQDYRGLYRQEVWKADEQKGHVNNVMYNRYAESARCNWTLNFAASDPAHKAEWMELITPKSIGLILRGIKTDYKFMSWLGAVASRRGLLERWTRRVVAASRAAAGLLLTKRMRRAQCQEANSLTPLDMKPMKWPDRVTVLHKLRNKPTTATDHFILDVLILSEVHRRPAARCIEDIVVYDYKKAQKSALMPFMMDKFRETFELQEQMKEHCSSRVKTLLDRVRQLEKGSWDRRDAKEDFGSAANP
ncbi:Nn.00g050130.m01.CDS01 [Neocucurbitaria sp. VM-36]